MSISWGSQRQDQRSHPTLHLLEQQMRFSFNHSGIEMIRYISAHIPEPQIWVLGVVLNAINSTDRFHTRLQLVKV